MPTADIARAFGLGTAAADLVFVARGAMGEVFRLETDRGPFAVKRLLWGPQGGEEENAAFQFAAANAGVPLARPLLTTNGDVLKRLDDGWWRAFEWVDGSHPTEPVGAAIATALGRLHSLQYDLGKQVDEWYAEAVGAERIDTAIDTAARHGFDIEQRRAELHALDEVVAKAPPMDVIGCHRDAQDQNVLVGSRGPVLIDWDNAGPGVAEREFGVALENFDTEVVPMVHAYRDAGGTFAPVDLTVFAMAFSANVHYVVQCCENLDSGAAEAALAFERPVLLNLATSESLAIDRFERILEMVPA
jgi:Ser/Thr protein kinase RdoA (MazF antagonist)